VPDNVGDERSGQDTVTGLLAEIADVGTDASLGGYTRPVYSAAELELRSWVITQAERRSLDVETDRNGIIWAWWHPRHLPLRNAVVTGSHMDSVPGGGAFDGPLGVASAFIAVDRLRQRNITPQHPLAIAAFPEEEGSRFGVACLGSRLMTGAIPTEKAARLTDIDGNTFADVAVRHGLDPAHLGHDEDSLRRIGNFVELHLEQGRGLVDLDQPVAIGGSILGHGRWRLSITGQGNHAGTTLMTDRQDPMVAAGQIIVAARDVALAEPDARATIGKLLPIPGGTNVIASRVDMWLDVRHPDDAVTAALVHRISDRAQHIAASEGCRAALTEESPSATAHFDTALRDELAAMLADAPILDTGAGHDAGVLASHVPTAMLFVRNPTGISHSRAEHVENGDAETGAATLTIVLERLLTT
jgi:beta-ureidopropionase / N-carbamoyl-L-amino-acid hydrolase